MNRRIRWQRLAPQNREQWRKEFYRHQDQRPRLLALKAIWDGKTLAEVCRTHKVGRKSLERYLRGGCAAMPAPERRAVPQALSLRQRQVLHYILRFRTTHADFRTGSTTEDVVFVVALTILRYVPAGFHQITLILDNARTHGSKMKAAVRALRAEIAAFSGWTDVQQTPGEFLPTPPYSPAFNPAEYLIHLVRQHLAQGPPLTPAQMTKLMHPIYRLPPNGNSQKWPKLE